MADKNNDLYLYEAIELKAEYQGRIEALKSLLPENRISDRFSFRNREELKYEPVEGFSVQDIRDCIKKLEYKKRKLNSAMQKTNFETSIIIQGQDMNLAEALELRKSVNQEIKELSSHLAEAAYKKVIYKEDRDIVESPELSYNVVKNTIEEKRLLFRELNRKLRGSSFETTIDFKDEDQSFTD